MRNGPRSACSFATVREDHWATVGGLPWLVQEQYMPSNVLKMPDEEVKAQYQQRAVELRALAGRAGSEIKRDAYGAMAEVYEKLACSTQPNL